MNTNVYVEYKGQQTEQKQLIEEAKKIWKEKGNKIKDLKTINLYFKPDEGKCYYIFNDDSSETNYFEI